MFVFGRHDLVEVDLSDPMAPRVARLISSKGFGKIHDAVAMGGRLYIVGDHGLEVADREGTRIEDRIQITADRRVMPMGRFLVLGGGPVVEVLDVTPYLEASRHSPEQETAPAKAAESPAKLER